MATPPSTSQSLIAEALARGDIDYPTSLTYRAWALFADSRLPPEYDGEAWQGEDTALFLDVSRAWSGLEAATQAALQPFLLRPTEEGSYYHPGAPPAGVAAAAAGTEDEAVECPFPAQGDRPDWRSTPTTHFVVWSCGYGEAGDVDADKRVVAAAVAEEVWDAMVPETGPPKPDSFPSFPLDARIDIYLVKPHLCKRRQDSCAPIPLDEQSTKPVLAAVATAPPCGPGSGGALTSSGYMILDRERVAAAPPVGPWPFRYTFAHEFFHLIENARNLQAQGGTCQGDAPQENVTSWLVEASAEWAAWAYFPDDGPDERAELFRRFQQRPASISLRSLLGLHPYQAFLYPFFVQQEKNESRTAFLDLWKDSGAVRNARQLDDRLDAILPFADHFRDFAVRNVDTTAAELPGDPLPLAERHQAQDPAIPENVKPIILEPAVTLDDAPAEVQRAASMQALTAQYERYTVGDGVRHVKVDLQELVNSGFVQIDVLANVAGTWERRRVPGLVFEFCRDDPGDDIGEFYVILSHHDRRQDLQASGTYRVRTRSTCPSGWSGSIRYLLTQDEHSVEDVVSGTEFDDEHEREEQVWTIVSTTPAGEPPELDQLEFAWRGRYDQLDTWSKSLTDPCLGQTIRTRSESSGVGSATDRLEMRPEDGGRYRPTPLIDVPLPQIVGIRSSSFQNCNGLGGDHTEPLGVRPDQFAGVIIGSPDLAILEPDPNDPIRFHGSSVWCDIQEPRPGGFYRLTATVSWDLRRR